MDKPEETCDLNPQSVCRLQTKLVPKLEPVEECEYQPKEFCQMKFSAPKRIPKPLKIKWCLKGEEEVEYPSPAAVIPAYLPPTYIAEASSRSATDDHELNYSPAKYEPEQLSHYENPLGIAESATPQPTPHYYKQYSYDPIVNSI